MNWPIEVGADDAVDDPEDVVVPDFFAVVVALVEPDVVERAAAVPPDVDGAWNDCPERLVPVPAPEPVVPADGVVVAAVDRLPEVEPVVPDPEEADDVGRATGWLQPVACAGAGFSA